MVRSILATIAHCHKHSQHQGHHTTSIVPATAVIPPLALSPQLPSYHHLITTYPHMSILSCAASPCLFWVYSRLSQSLVHWLVRSLVRWLVQSLVRWLGQSPVQFQYSLMSLFLAVAGYKFKIFVAGISKYNFKLFSFMVGYKLKFCFFSRYWIP